MSDDNERIQIGEINAWELAWAMRLEREAFPNDSWSADNYLDLLEEGGSAFVLREYGAPAAILWVNEEGHGTVELHSLAVKREYQRQGFARRLMEDVENRARASGGTDRLILQVRLDNPARKLYESLGYRIERQEDDYYSDGDPCLHMIKLLT